MFVCLSATFFDIITYFCTPKVLAQTLTTWGKQLGPGHTASFSKRFRAERFAADEKSSLRQWETATLRAEQSRAIKSFRTLRLLGNARAAAAIVIIVSQCLCWRDPNRVFDIATNTKMMVTIIFTMSLRSF